MSFLSEYDGLAKASDDPKKVGMAQAGLVQKWLFGQAFELFEELRETRPVFASPAATIVTQYRDVREVLEQDAVFSVKTYAPKVQNLLGGPFVLGMANTPQYERELSIMRLAASRDDIARIRGFVTDAANGIVETAKPGGKIDVVADLTRVVAARLVADYFGVAGPDEPTLMRWMRALFWEIFINLSNDEKVRTNAESVAAELNPYLDELITTRRSEIEAGKEVGDDVLTRMIRLQADPSTHLDDLGIRRCITGIIIGAVDTTSKSVTQAVNQLLERPKELAAARDAASRDDDGAVSRYVFEALRFDPQNDFLYRVCERPYVLAKGTPRATEIPAGSFVIAATLSAMFDSAVVDDPKSFRVDRPPETYMFNGHALHTCFGQHINQIQIPSVAKPLLALPGLRRADGEGGQIRYDGPFPDSLTLHFDAP